MTSCSWIMPACTREKESKKQSQRGVQRCSTFQPIVQTSTPSNSSLPNSNPSCARSPPILSKASHSRSTACARPSSLASTRSHVQNAPHISPIRGMGNLNGKCSKCKTNRRLRSWPEKVENRLTTVLSTSSDIKQNIVGHTICCQTGSSKVKNRVEPKFVRSELRTNFHDNSFRRRTCRLPANGSDRNRGLRFA